MNFNKIKELCEQRNLSINDLAGKIGLSKPGLYRSIQNKTMKVDILERISEVLKVPISIFFYEGPSPEELKRKKDDLEKEIEILNNIREANYLKLNLYRSFFLYLEKNFKIVRRPKVELNKEEIETDLNIDLYQDYINQFDKMELDEARRRTEDIVLRMIRGM